MTKDEEAKNAIGERVAEIEMLTFMANEFDDEVIMIVKYVDSELTEQFNKQLNKIAQL